MGASPHNLEDEAESQKKSHHPGDPGGVFCKIHRKVPEVPTFVSERSLPRTFPRICRLSSKAEQGWQVVGVVWLGLSPSVSFHHRDYDVYLNQPGTVFLTSTIWNFKIYILSPRKKTINKNPQQQNKYFGDSLSVLFEIEPTPKKELHQETADQPGSSTFTQLHVTRQSNAFAPPPAPPGGWQGLRRPAAVASGASKTAVKVGEIRKLGSFFVPGDLGGFKCSKKNRLNILLGQLLVNYMISFRWIETSKL